MDKILITGAGGFIGQRLAGLLKEKGYYLKGIFHRQSDDISRKKLYPVGLEEVFSEKYTIDIADNAALPEEVLNGVDVIIHLAGRAHVLRDTLIDPLAEYRRINTFATEKLARKALSAGVRRFIYVSSLKVNGEESGKTPLDETSREMPCDPYGVSKWEAENLLMNIARQGGMEIVILRPPLVYGPGVKGNFLRLLNIIYRQIPLPLGAVRNKRSMVALENVVDILSLCIHHPKACGMTYVLSDGEDVSIPDLVRLIAGKMGKMITLPRISPVLLQAGARLIGKEEDAKRLLGTLVVDVSKIREDLGWTPPVSLDRQLDGTIAWYLKEHVTGAGKKK